ncbi:MAG: lytic transglycosylase domain-containing protein, partial [Clostridiaceae bacterium]|nr:lytic transglycosylase domain-containing protein [Clostridiaceae bacterium]
MKLLKNTYTMNKIIKNIEIVLLTVTLIITCIIILDYIFSEIQSIKTEIKSIKIEKQFVPLTDFELIELAIIWQESKGNPNPKYSDGESEGILQITPIYVKEANRILGKNKYTL